MSHPHEPSPRSGEIHTPVTPEEIAHAFEEEAPDADLSRYAAEDWLTLIVFWGMTVCVFLQFFTRYVLNNSLAWTEEIAINCLVVVVFMGSVMCVRMSRHIRWTSSITICRRAGRGGWRSASTSCASVSSPTPAISCSAMSASSRASGWSRSTCRDRSSSGPCSPPSS